MSALARYNLDRPPPLGRGSCDICSSAVGLGHFFLSPAVTAQLCVVHRDVNFLRRAGGQTFIDAMASHWRTDAKGLSPRRQAALDAHRLRVRATVTARRRPGSYSWPLLRLHAESLFAKGHDPNVVIERLRHMYRESFAQVPSICTMRRWFTQARWLTDPARWKTAYALRAVVRRNGGRKNSHRRSFLDITFQHFPHPHDRRPPPF